MKSLKPLLDKGLRVVSEYNVLMSIKSVNMRGASRKNRFSVSCKKGRPLSLAKFLRIPLSLNLTYFLEQ